MDACVVVFPGSNCDRDVKVALEAVAGRPVSMVCRDVHLRVEQPDTLFTSRYRKDEVIRIPIAHGDGNYFADEATLDALEAEGRVVFRYVDTAGEVTEAANPNGARRNIAGICDK